ncbi:hypothetical protein BP6252_03237 [Coleophoma cylindrospora]|uniref:Uncharacterized protein n=1 Tax=Coleophoma cylindrospora TaxID=1849047 RepID=A0A3D8S745_9HELO|nr:hypothetical protein BP6252_03237 [Coleophoma cylindrospora]
MSALNSVGFNLENGHQYNHIYVEPPRPAQLSQEPNLSTPRQDVHAATPRSCRRTSSSQASTRSSIVSRSDSDSSVMSAATSASSVSQTSWDINPTNDDGNNLPCEFILLGCEQTFRLEEVEAWISHHEAHFTPHDPPSNSICTICDDPTSRFSDPSDVHRNWRNRMIHISDHLIAGERCLRPDFRMIDYLYKIGKLEKTLYEYNMSYTERPDCSILVAPGFVPPENREKQERASRVVHDQAREDRKRAREKTGRTGGRLSAGRTNKGRS